MTVDEAADLTLEHDSNRQSEYRWPRHFAFLLLFPPGYHNISFFAIDQLVRLARH